MKKAIFIATILSLSVFSTACINNFAVQELNNKAMVYMQKGDYENAISRLKSSVDLDASIFESQYNLAIAYTNSDDYDEAIETFKKAIDLKPTSSDAHYSLAVAQENYAKDVLAGTSKKQKLSAEDKEDSVESSETVDLLDKYSPTQDEIKEAIALYNDSIKSYEEYLKLSKAAKDTVDVNEKISLLNSEIEKLSSDEVKE